MTAPGFLWDKQSVKGEKREWGVTGGTTSQPILWPVITHSEFLHHSGNQWDLESL